MSSFKTTKFAAYTANLSMSVIGIISPLLFSSFQEIYGISYGLLGLLVLVNFCTQLLIDLVFSFYSHRFNISKTVKIMPVLTTIGLLLYAVIPIAFPNAAYFGIVFGTIVFAASSGLSEVLISPIIAAIYPENTEHEMSKLHSVYAWGVVVVVILSSVVLNFIGKQNWFWLVFGWTSIPILSTFLFAFAKIPSIDTPQKSSGAFCLFGNKTLILCILCIFFGGASECTMTQWSSGYIEQALQIPKLWGDIFGTAMFALMLGIGRSLYGAIGKKIYLILIGGSVGAVVCYLTAALSPLPILGLIACALTGLCTSMLWPGSLIVVSDHFPKANIAVFALMAAGGDLGGSIGPQLTGIIADAVIANPGAVSFAENLGMSVEQLGMKAGILFCVIFPILAVLCFSLAYKARKKTLLSPEHPSTFKKDQSIPPIPTDPEKYAADQTDAEKEFTQPSETHKP